MSRAHSATFPSLHLRHSSFSNPSVALPTSQLILQPFRHFTYVTAHSPTLPSFHLPYSSFSNPSVASPMSQLILQPSFRFSYVTGSSLTSPGKPPMITTNFPHERLVKITQCYKQSDFVDMKIMSDVQKHFIQKWKEVLSLTDQPYSTHMIHVLKYLYWKKYIINSLKVMLQKLRVHRCGTGGSTRACLRSGPGFYPRSKQVSWVRFFRGFSSPARQMPGSFKPPRSPNIISPSLSSPIIIH